MPTVLGLSAHYHDAAAALVDQDGIVAACAEERFSRIKHDAGFPARAIAACLRRGGLTLGDVDAVVFYEQPVRTFDRVVSTWLDQSPGGYPFFAASVRGWTGARLFQGQRLRRDLRRLDRRFDPDRLGFLAHHHSHAASAFYPSPFERAAILTVDGVGEWATTALAVGEGATITPLAELHHPHSLGLLYAMFTAWCGFRVNEGEYKVMGLAPYGTPRFVDVLLERVVHLLEDGSFALDPRYVQVGRDLRPVPAALVALLGVPVRAVGEPLTDAHRDLAASVQAVTERVVLHLARGLHARCGLDALCLAGGVALNGVAMERLRREGPFAEVWVQPAAGDDGGALGSALAGLYGLGVSRAVGSGTMAGARLGPSYPDGEIEGALRAAGVQAERLDEDELIERTVDTLVAGGAVGWFQGRSEYGPRALGGRSILADPRDAGARDRLNATVKRREAFRPFAPVVLAERAVDWFDLDGPSPHMSFVVRAKQPDRMPAAVHIDGTSRVQTAEADSAPRLHKLLRAFERRTGVPVLLNTSFNVAGEPIVETPDDAVRTCEAAGLDGLAAGRLWVSGH